MRRIFHVTLTLFSPFMAAALAGCTANRAGPAERVQITDEPGAIGSTIDAFSFRTPGGRSIDWDAARAELTTEGSVTKPAAVVLHVFQPDCNACRDQARALEGLHKERSETGVAIVAIAHRGDAPAMDGFVRELGLTYPTATGTGSDWAFRWGRGDPMYIADASGKVVYSQVGYRDEDAETWRSVLDDLRGGRPVALRHAERTERLSVGERMPDIRLPDLAIGRPMALTSGPQGLTFTDAAGRTRRYRGSIGFFSRY